MGPLFDPRRACDQAHEKETGKRDRSRKLPALGLLVALAVCTAIAGGVLAPASARAAGDPALEPRGRHNPPNQHNEGNCIHNHYLDPNDPSGKTELSQNECEAGNGGKAQPCKIVKRDQTLTGTCQTKKTGRPSPNCVCIPTKQKGMENALRGMQEATNTASLVVSNASALEPTTCSQLILLLTSLQESLDFVMTLGPVDIGDSELLGIVDTFLIAWPQIGSFASSCGTTFPDRTSDLLQIKSEMISAFINGSSS